jgi:uncharacterized protein (DUF433 family)
MPAMLVATVECGLPWQAQPTSWIEKDPGICGGDARIRATRHMVAGLVEWHRLGLSDDRILEHHPDLTYDDLDAAWAYYEKNREEIDQAIQDDEEA